MRKFILFVLIACNCFVSLFSISCSEKHRCTYDVKTISSEYLKSPASCQARAEYYYVCECGKIGSETFFDGYKLDHDFTAEVVDEKYLIQQGTCQEGATYYKSCVHCGQKANLLKTFTVNVFADCSFDQEIADVEYLYSEATKTQSAVYYKSCVCGKVGNETFSYGEPLKEYTDEEKKPYTPVSLTVTLFDTEVGVYGFTCNTEMKPLRPVLQIAKGNSLDNAVEYNAIVEKASTYLTNNTPYDYYIVKAEAKLEKNATYTYRIYDKYVDTGTKLATLNTKDLNAQSFSFVHVADTQEYPEKFKDVLKIVSPTTDFLLHTGDVVETSKYESEWKAMLNGNFKYLSSIPFMAISGNHETTYQNGSNETYKHFHNKIPSQVSTTKGYFYSFVYGNVKFIMLNTNDLSSNKLKKEQYDWLINELENNNSTWTVVAMHNPMYSVGKYGADSSKNAISLSLRSQLQGIFNQYGVDIVLQGHDHAVSRTFPIDGNGNPKSENIETINGVDFTINPEGVLYLMNGTAGGQTRSPYSTDSNLYKYAQASNECSWAQFDIDGNKLSVSVNYYTSSGIKTYQKWGIKKQ